MQIRTLPLPGSEGDGGMLEVVGPMDPNHPVIVRARQMIIDTGSKDMLQSFDRAVADPKLLF